MSIVAVKKYKDKIDIASDSFIGFGYDTQLKDNTSKLFKRNDIVVGGVGFAKDVSLFKLFCRDRKPSRSDEDAIIDFVREFVKWSKEIDNTYKLDSDFIIIYKRKVWYISGLYVKEIKTYYSMGAGQDMAQAILHTGGSPKEAVGVACEISIYCEKPVNTIEVKI